MGDRDSRMNTDPTIPDPAATAPNSAATGTNVPQAQGVAPITKEMSDAIAAAVGSAVSGLKDSIFAEARRTFTQGQKKPAKTETTEQEPVATHLDIKRARELDRALTRSGYATRVNEMQYQLLEDSFAKSSGVSADEYVKAFFHGWGQEPSAPAPTPSQPVNPTQPNVSQPQPSAQPAGPPQSSRGAPTPPRVPLEEQDLVTMSESDRAAYIREKGVRAYSEKLARDLKGRPIQLRR